MNTPVSFELARLLKEKEVNIPAFYYYENEKLVEPYLENGSSTDVEFRVDLSDLKESFNKWSKRISAPTIAEVVMWLYDKHGIWIFPDRTNKWFWTIQKPNSEYIHQEDLPLTEKSIYNGFNSPTEAYEAAIEYCLNKLI